ncbi:MAG: hypothetical protein PQJ58_04015 [Spirochaetales bacterium]|nr:hypothetical protein [Spirochaetales bacterium]
MNKTLFLPLILLIFSLYYFVFPREGSPETVWTAVYCEPFADIDHTPPPLQDTIVINQGEYKAVLGPDASQNYISPRGFRGYLSAEHALYRDKGTLYLKEFGSASFGITENGASPYVYKDRFFAVDYGSAFIEEYDSSGSILWTWKGLAPVTAITWNDSYTGIGSLDGTVRLVNRKGEVTGYPAFPDTGDHIVYGVALSDDSDRLAVISGLKEQYLRVFSLSDAPVLLDTVKLESQYRRPVKMFYSPDSSFLWVEQEGGLLQYNDDGSTLFLPVSGQFLTMNYDREQRLLYLLSQDLNKEGQPAYFMLCYSPEGTLVFISDSDFYPFAFHLNGDSLLYSMNNDILLLKRREM